jgi:hypothetical protein
MIVTELEKAKELLYGKDGLGVTNFKLFPGSSRDVTVEQIAGQINASLSDLMDDNGEAELVG